MRNNLIHFCYMFILSSPILLYISNVESTIPYIMLVIPLLCDQHECCATRDHIPSCCHVNNQRVATLPKHATYITCYQGQAKSCSFLIMKQKKNHQYFSKSYFFFLQSNKISSTCNLYHLLPGASKIMLSSYNETKKKKK